MLVCALSNRKFEEIYPPEVAEFVYITDDTYTAKQVGFATLRFKINGRDIYFFVIFGDSPQLILTPPFINFSNFLRDYTEVHKYITLDVSLV